MLKIRKKDAFVRPFKVRPIYAIYKSLGIVTVQNCAKITTKSLVWHIKAVLCLCSHVLSKKNHDVINELSTSTWVEL